MCFNYSALNGKIKEVYNSQYAFAYDMKMSERTLSLKLNNKRNWKQTEMFKACELLGIPIEEMPIYFLPMKFKMIEQFNKDDSTSTLSV